MANPLTAGLDRSGPAAGIPARAIVLDTETTGLSPNQRPADRIVEIAACELIHGELTGQVFHRYLNPDRPVPKAASEVHGLTGPFLADKPRFREIGEAFRAFVGDERTPVFAHNAPFDQRFIEAEFDWADIECVLSFHCSLRLARAVQPPTENMRLETLAAHANYNWADGAAHSALADTRALAHVLTHCLWPMAAEQRAAARPNRALSPKPAAPKTATLPDGYVPRTADNDARIRRYDDLDMTDRTFGRGKRWTPDEEKRLVDAFVHHAASIEALVDSHGRTPTAIFLRLEQAGAIAPGHPYDRNAVSSDQPDSGADPMQEPTKQSGKTPSLG